MASFAAAPDQPAYIHQLAVELDAAFRALAAVEKPVVAAVHGAVAGAGLALMLSCDVIVAAPATKFVFAYPGIGFTPDCGVLLPAASRRGPAAGARVRPHRQGRRRLPQALEWGLVSEVADDPERAGPRAGGRVRRGSGARPSGNVRRLLRQGWEMSRAETGAEEARTITEMVKGEEAQRLIARFVDR